MKILNSKNKNFDKNLDKLLLRRQKKINSSSASVMGIINDVRKNKLLCCKKASMKSHLMGGQSS